MHINITLFEFLFEVFCISQLFFFFLAAVNCALISEYTKVEETQIMFSCIVKILQWKMYFE